MTAPRLAPADVAREIDRIFSKKRRAEVAALYGRGEAGTVEARGATWSVVPTTCELDLRAKMPPPGKLEFARTVFLVDWTEQPLPLDLGSRFAAGRIFQIAQDTRLAALFGARAADPALLGTGLAAVLLAGDVDGLKKVSGLRVERVDAYRRFLEAFAGLPAAGALKAPDLLAWCAENDLGRAFAARAEEGGAWDVLRTELRALVAELLGPLCGAAWRAWEGGLGARFLELAILVEAHHHTADPVADGLLQGSADALGPGFGGDLLGKGEPLAAGLLREALGVWSGPLHGGDLRGLTANAESLLPQAGFETTRAASGWLPAGHADREGRLAVALEALAANPAPDHHARAVEAAESLGAHGLDTTLRDASARRLRTMVLRLGTWLAVQAQRSPPPSAPVFQPAIELARRFAEEGGFVDWARQQLRRPMPFDKPLQRAVQAVLAAADAARREDDRVFSAGVLRWVEAGKPAHDVLPIANVTRRLGADLLAGHPNRKLLVVLMDGMSWASAVQLMDHLESQRWEPVLWRPKGHKARASLPPVVVEIPTMTHVSRAAFFAGRSDKKLGDKSTGEDLKRWAGNAGLREANGGELPPLVLKSRLMSGGTLADDVRADIESDHRVVGVVVNAIDDQLKGSPQILADYSTVPIRPLLGLLQAADAADRVVLLASDHGHVPGDALSKHGEVLDGAADSGARWRELEAGEEPLPFERRLPDACWRRKTHQGMAVVWDDSVAHRYPKAGEHGGLSLAEAVAPAILIARDWLHGVQGDDALQTRPFPHPAWWDLRLDAGGVSAAAPAPKKAPPKVGKTLSMFSTPAPAPAEAPAPRGEAELVKALRASPVFAANVLARDESPEAQRKVEDVLRWLDVLAAAPDGALPDKEFARRCGIRARRLAGRVAEMGILNADGFAMVEHDTAGGQIRLHRERLVQMYGLKL